MDIGLSSHLGGAWKKKMSKVFLQYFATSASVLSEPRSSKRVKNENIAYFSQMTIDILPAKVSILHSGMFGIFSEYL